MFELQSDDGFWAFDILTVGEIEQLVPIEEIEDFKDELAYNNLLSEDDYALCVWIFSKEKDEYDFHKLVTGEELSYFIMQN